MEFSCKLKIVLAERGIKQKWFAQKIGISPAALSALVNNKTLPTFEVTYKITHELKMNVMDLWEPKQGEVKAQ